MSRDNRQAAQDARQLIQLVEAAPGAGVHRHELMEKVPLWDFARFKTAMFVAYRWGRIDLIRNYLVLPAPKPRPKPDRWIKVTPAEGDPFLIGTAVGLVVQADGAATWALDKTEGVVAKFYRDRGARFAEVTS